MTTRIENIRCSNCQNEEGVIVRENTQWIREPCPSCGSTEITEADQQGLAALQNIVEILEDLSADALEEEPAALDIQDVDYGQLAMDQGHTLH